VKLELTNKLLDYISKRIEREIKLTPLWKVDWIYIHNVMIDAIEDYEDEEEKSRREPFKTKYRGESPYHKE